MARGQTSSERSLTTIFILTLMGLFFSGYLSFIKFFSGICAFNEPCPYFLGYPACWYGFAMYLVLSVVTLLALTRTVLVSAALAIDIAISGLGIIFAGSFVVQELLESRITGMLGLSTCTYGLIFYIIIFITSVIALKKERASMGGGAR